VQKTIQLAIKDILKHYPKANVFSLTAPYNDQASPKHPYGIYHLDPKVAEDVLKKLDQNAQDFFMASYASFEQKDKDALPPFEDLLKEINEECKRYVDDFLKGHDMNQNPYINDLFMEEKTKYTHPPQLYHVYHHYGHIYLSYWDGLNQMIKNSKKRDVTHIFEDPRYQDLKTSYLKHDISYIWHASISSRLSVTYYFKLTNQSKAWLLKQEDVFNFSYLDDLALYQDDDILFSSSTTEGMYKDVKEDEEYTYL
jgi:hypothetical protein